MKIQFRAPRSSLRLLTRENDDPLRVSRASHANR